MKPSHIAADAFGDILSAQGFKPIRKLSIGEMKQQRELENLPPHEIKVRNWTTGKERNIRALLGSLSSVIWGGCNWKQVQMSELLTSEQIKKQYRRALLAIHPDKQMGTENELLAKAIFSELNAAYNEFMQASV